jgi:hypothetical protein
MDCSKAPASGVEKDKEQTHEIMEWTHPENHHFPPWTNPQTRD